MLGSALAERETTDRSRRLAWRDRLGLIGALALGVGLIGAFRARLNKPLWIDEQWRAYHASFGPDWWQQLRVSPDGPLAAGLLLIEWLLAGILGSAELALRLPMALSLIGLSGGLFVLSRRWLGPAAALLTPLSLLLTSAIVDFATQLKPYTFEAMITLWALLLWLHADERPPARWPQRLALGLALGLGCLCSTPTIFVLGPLLGLGALRAAQPWPGALAWLRQLWPSLLALGLALLHLALFILPQSQLTSSDYWAANFAPRDGMAASFVVGQLLGYFPELLTAPQPETYLPPVAVALLTGATLLAFGLGVLAASHDRAGRALLAAVVGALALQLVASALRLWPFGNVRVNLFLAPLLWLIGALGVALPLRWLRGALPAVGRGRAALLGACAGLGIALGCLVALFTLGQARYIYDRQQRTLYGDGMREMVAVVRQAASAEDAAVVIHPQAWKGWEYYMRFYAGYPALIQQRPRIAAARSIFIRDAAVADDALVRAVESLPDAPQVWVMALEGTSGDQLNAQLGQLDAAGFQIQLAHATPFTGALWRLTRKP